MNPTPLLSLVSFCGLLCAVPAQTVVSPASRTLVEGSASTSYPLGRADGRFQQIHADLPPTLTSIVGHAFRRDAISTRGSIAAFSVDLEVRVSVAATTPATASTTFANNHGPSPVTVLPRTILNFPATGRPNADPAPTFEYVIPYATPFSFPAGSTLCVETIVYGNTTSSGNDRNFSLLLDAHELRTDGKIDQPGFRFGTGCAAPGQSATHYGRLDLSRDNGLVDLVIESRNAAATTDPTQPTMTALVLGTAAISTPWSWLPNCTQYSPFDLVLTLAGVTDAAGDLDETLAGFEALPDGFRFVAQLVSGNLATGDLTFADASWMTIPTPDPTTLPAVRISAANDHTAATGSVSASVPVTMFL
ncbi:MAG: hypothetical protein KDB80_14255 [Planctomycetes bacterium]|nr:hypothetical protein [Planctomycetota bacterium]